MAQESFKIEREMVLDKRVMILHVFGNVDAHTYDQVEENLNATFRGRVHRVIIDMARVDYISSAGTGVFIGALSEAQHNGGNVVLLNLSPTVLQVFELLGLAQLFPIFKDRASALNYF